MSSEHLLYVALDSKTAAPNIRLAERLVRHPDPKFGYKINLDGFTPPGTPRYLEDIRRLGRPVFADLKMNNGARTMSNIAETLANRGISHINLWAHAERLIKPVARALEGSETQLLGVTVTTHFTEEYCQRLYGKSLPATVRMLSEIALENGCNGIILPGTALDAVKDFDCTKVVPAIRPLHYADRKTNDQEQPVTPTEALVGGATILVCGSPIAKADNPYRSLDRILEEMRSA